MICTYVTDLYTETKCATLVNRHVTNRHWKFTAHGAKQKDEYALALNGRRGAQKKIRGWAIYV